MNLDSTVCHPGHFLILSSSASFTPWRYRRCLYPQAKTWVLLHPLKFSTTSNVGEEELHMRLTDPVDTPTKLSSTKKCPSICLNPSKVLVSLPLGQFLFPSHSYLHPQPSTLPINHLGKRSLHLRAPSLSIVTSTVWSSSLQLDARRFSHPSEASVSVVLQNTDKHPPHDQWSLPDLPGPSSSLCASLLIFCVQSPCTFPLPVKEPLSHFQRLWGRGGMVPWKKKPKSLTEARQQGLYKIQKSWHSIGKEKSDLHDKNRALTVENEGMQMIWRRHRGIPCEKHVLSRLG